MIIEGAFAARKPLKKKRAKKRKDSRPRCGVRGCTRPAAVILESGSSPALAVFDLLCKTHAKHEADRLCRLIVFERDEHRCQRCGATEDGPWSLQWAHILTRGELSIRWNPLNSMVLCAKDHMAFTHRPEAWHDWIDERFPARWELLRRLRRESLARGDKPDYAEIIASLRSQAAGL